MPLFERYDEYKEIILMAGSKAIFRDTNGRQGSGMIIDESKDRKDFIVAMEGRKGEEINMTKPIFDKENGIFIYHHNDDNKFNIVEIDPIRIKISLSSGTIQILCNTFSLNDNNKYLILL